MIIVGTWQASGQFNRGMMTSYDYIISSVYKGRHLFDGGATLGLAYLLSGIAIYT